MAYKFQPMRVGLSFASSPSGTGTGAMLNAPSNVEGKEMMRGLNERLKDYLSQVKVLEETNGRLEEQIKQALTEKRAGGDRDWSGYENIINTLREQVRDMTMENTRITLQIDNARLAADDFKIKLESEAAVRQGVEQDVASLRKLIDDTNMSRMQLECQVESLKEELVFLSKTHEEDVANLQGQIRGSNVNVQMEASGNQDLTETIDKIRKQYEMATQKNQEETEAWYKSKLNNVSADVTRSSEELQQGKSDLTNLQRQKQALEIELQTVHSMNRSLDDTLKDTAGRYAKDMIGHNMIIQQLEAELSDVHAQVTRQRAEYQALLNIKSKLEEEITTYHHLLEGTVLESYDGTDGGSGQNDFVMGKGAKEDADIKNLDLPEDINIEDGTVKGGNFEDSDLLGYNEDSVDFSLEQALNAAPLNMTPDPSLIINDEAIEEELMAQKEQELNAANAAMNEEYMPEETAEQKEELPVIIKEVCAPVTPDLCQGFKEVMDPSVVCDAPEIEEVEKEEIKDMTIVENKAQPEQVVELSDSVEEEKNNIVEGNEAEEEINSSEECKEENKENISSEIESVVEEVHENKDEVVDQEVEEF